MLTWTLRRRTTPRRGNCHRLGIRLVIAIGVAPVLLSGSITHLAGASTSVNRFVAIRMTNSLDGWAFNDTQVLWTTDGGIKWIDRTPAMLGKSLLAPINYGGQFTDFTTPGTRVAWFAVAIKGRIKIFSTSNGGASWRSFSVAPAGVARTSSGSTPIVLGLVGVSPRDGWLLVSSGGVAAGSEDVELYRTTDWSHSWQLEDAATQERPSPKGLPVGGDKTGLAFAQASLGWITGNRGSQRGIFLYFTRNAAHLWRGSVLPTPTGYSLNNDSATTYSPQFVGSFGVLPVDWPNHRTIIFYVSANGGHSWTPTTPISLPGGDYPSAWSWPDIYRAFVVTGSTFCTSSSNGRTWSCPPTPAVLRGVTELQFLNHNFGWAVVRGRILRTSDGGANWTPIA